MLWIETFAREGSDVSANNAGLMVIGEGCGEYVSIRRLTGNRKTVRYLNIVHNNIHPPLFSVNSSGDDISSLELAKPCDIYTVASKTRFLDRATVVADAPTVGGATDPADGPFVPESQAEGHPVDTAGGFVKAYGNGAASSSQIGYRFWV